MLKPGLVPLDREGAELVKEERQPLSLIEAQPQKPGVATLDHERISIELKELIILIVLPFYL